MKAIRACAVSLVLCCATGAPAQATDGPDKFQQGVAAYRSGDYAAALAAFLEAQPTGQTAANLQFNLGLTYYQLERYTEARAAFERLRAYPGYAAIADLHLGLIAAQLGERAQAMELWQPLASSAPEQALRDRASLAISRLNPEQPSGPAAFFAGSVGYDTNPALLDENAQATRDSNSASLDLLGTLESTVSNRDDRAVAVHAGGYLREYTQDNGLGQSGVFAGLSREHDSADRRRGLAALDLGTSFLEGQHFLDSATASLGTAPQRGVGGGTLNAQLTRVQAAPAFAYLEGWRLRGAAEWTARANPDPWKLSYLLELNDRADLVSGSEFFSHSPIRHTLGLVLPQTGPGAWSLQWAVRYRLSRYRDADRFLEGAVLREERRVDQLVQAGGRARRKIARGCFAFIDYEYSHNASTIDAFAYDRHVLQVGLEWSRAGA